VTIAVPASTKVDSASGSANSTMQAKATKNVSTNSVFNRNRTATFPGGVGACVNR
jgi:hypothetical protein